MGPSSTSVPLRTSNYGDGIIEASLDILDRAHARPGPSRLRRATMRSIRLEEGSTIGEFGLFNILS